MNYGDVVSVHVFGLGAGPPPRASPNILLNHTTCGDREHSTSISMAVSATKPVAVLDYFESTKAAAVNLLATTSTDEVCGFGCKYGCECNQARRNFECFFVGKLVCVNDLIFICVFLNFRFYERVFNC